MSLEQMAEAGEAYRPDATVAPDLFRNVNRAERIISAQNAFLIQDAMRDVIRRGTGVRARTLGRSDLSGKTGTSNDRRDAWFAGFNADMVGVVWVGYDDNRSLGLSGGEAALPVWTRFMKAAVSGTEPARFAPPAGVRVVDVDPETSLVATESCPARERDAFRAETAPKDLCTRHPD